MPPWHRRKGHRARVRPDGTRRRTQGELEARAERQAQRAAVTPPPPLAHASRRRPPSPPPPSRKCARADPEAVEVVEVVDVEDVEEEPTSAPAVVPRSSEGSRSPPTAKWWPRSRAAAPDRVPGPSSRDSRSRPSSSSSGMASLATRCPREAPRTPVYGERRRRISGILSCILRHDAVRLRVPILGDGTCDLRTLVQARDLRQLGVTEGEVLYVVDTDRKGRFEEIQYPSGPRIRAVQGHNRQVQARLDDTRMYETLTARSVVGLTAFHGTRRDRLAEIMNSGLQAGGPRGDRAHIHMATSMDGVRADSEVVLVMNPEILLAAGLTLFRSRNGYLLTPDAIAPEHIQRVIRCKSIQQGTHAQTRACSDTSSCLSVQLYSFAAQAASCSRRPSGYRHRSWARHGANGRLYLSRVWKFRYVPAPFRRRWHRLTRARVRRALLSVQGLQVRLLGSCGAAVSCLHARRLAQMDQDRGNYWRPHGGPRNRYREDGTRRRSAGELAKRATRAAEKAAQTAPTQGTAAAEPAAAAAASSTVPPATQQRVEASSGKQAPVVSAMSANAPAFYPKMTQAAPFLGAGVQTSQQVPPMAPSPVQQSGHGAKAAITCCPTHTADQGASNAQASVSSTPTPLPGPPQQPLTKDVSGGATEQQHSTASPQRVDGWAQATPSRVDSSTQTVPPPPPPPPKRHRSVPAPVLIPAVAFTATESECVRIWGIFDSVREISHRLKAAGHAERYRAFLAKGHYRKYHSAFHNSPATSGVPRVGNWCVGAAATCLLPEVHVFFPGDQPEAVGDATEAWFGRECGATLPHEPLQLPPPADVGLEASRYEWKQDFCALLNLTHSLHEGIPTGLYRKLHWWDSLANRELAFAQFFPRPSGLTAPQGDRGAAAEPLRPGRRHFLTPDSDTSASVAFYEMCCRQLLRLKLRVTLVSSSSLCQVRGLFSRNQAWWLWPWLLALMFKHFLKVNFSCVSYAMCQRTSSRPGPKSGARHTYVFLLVIFSTLVVSSGVRVGGQGTSPPPGGAGAPGLSVNKAVPKPRGRNVPDLLASPPTFKTAKRAFQRALRRAQLHGTTMYRGRCRTLLPGSSRGDCSVT